MHLNQFSGVIRRSKSFVNAAMQTIGYRMFKMSRERAKILTAVFPELPLESLRYWTFRELSSEVEPFIGTRVELRPRPIPERLVFPPVRALLSQQGLPLPLSWVGTPGNIERERITG
jgi:hypothetical protein